jgi:hypothetical protein
MFLDNFRLSTTRPESSFVLLQHGFPRSKSCRKKLQPHALLRSPKVSFKVNDEANLV